MTEVRSVAQALAALKRGEAVNTVGVGGMLTVARSVSDPRKWYCAFYRAMPEELRQRYAENLTDVGNWLRIWFPKLKGRDPRGEARRGCASRLSAEERRRFYAPARKTRKLRK